MEPLNRKMPCYRISPVVILLDVADEVDGDHFEIEYFLSNYIFSIMKHKYQEHLVLGDFSTEYPRGCDMIRRWW